MSANWEDKTLGEVVTLQRGHDLPEEQRQPGPVPIVGSAGVTGFHTVARAKGPGVTIGRSGVGSMGVVSYCPIDYWPHNAVLYVTDFKGNDPRFVYYLFKTINFRRFNSGSAQASLNRNYIYPVRLRIPSPARQRAIAAILAAYDDKIELNRRMNETLEAMARAIFKSWFVDFDPVRAKSEGRQPQGIPAHIAALFPSTFQDSPLGPIPSGWQVLPAGEIASIGIGRTPPRKEQRWFTQGVGDFRWMSIRDMGECGCYIERTSEFLTAEAVERFRVPRIPDDTVVLSFKLTVGRVAITDGEMLSNEAIAHLLPISATQLTSSYLWCYLKSFDYDQLGSTSSIATAVNSESIRKMPVLIPPPAVAEAFAAKIRPWFELMKQLPRESQTLASLRDTLLPKLLSGKLEVGATA